MGALRLPYVHAKRGESVSHDFPNDDDMTRELVEIQGKRIKDIQFGRTFIAILVEGMVCEQL